MLKRLLALLALAGGLITHAHAQTFSGQLPAGSVLCNPTATNILLAQPCNTFTLGTGTSSINVDTYGGGSPTGKTAFQITNSDSSALSGTEHYSVWIGATTNGTGDGSVPATSYALGVSAIKNNWQTSTVAGEYAGINTVCRGGFNNAVTSGDVACYQANAGVSFSNNFAVQWEGVGGYLPGGSTTGSLFINNQIGGVRATGLDTGSNTGVGFYTQAQNGLLGHAFSASNLCAAPKFGTCSKWLDFLNYLYDDGTHTAYNAFNVGQTGLISSGGPAASGALTLNGSTSGSTTLSVGATGGNPSVTGSLGVAGTLTAGTGGGTGGSLTLNGATSGNFSISVSATAGHLFWASSATPTLTAGCNGAGSSISGSDALGTVVGQTAVATSCTVTFGTAYAVAPRCTPTGRTTPVTSYSTSTSTLVINFASTASATFDWTCYGA